MDSQHNKTCFFLGANSGDGFCSLYDGFVDCAHGDFLWVIKGGPGCGKSSFMRHIARTVENAGCEVEYILCSGDPDSLDGIYIPRLRTAYVDGTAPHVMETRLPGAGSLYLDLGAFYDADALTAWLDEIGELFGSYQALYARAYDLLAASARVRPDTLPGLWDNDLPQRIRRRALAAASREFAHAHGSGKVSRRFLSGITCRGGVFLWETVSHLCEKVYLLDNELGLAPIFLDTIRFAADEKGLDYILCPTPLQPDVTEALLIPGLKLAFVASSSGQTFKGPVYRHLRLDAMADRESFRKLRPEFRRQQHLRAELLRAATNALAGAKSLHDALESIYNPHVDFSGLYKLADEHGNYLLGQFNDSAAASVCS
ncbi:MAG: hypothetical protein Q4A39_05315 [Eubacteriales bacterium]|nr:hypothetical protein [Eubacteriales bacterium]